MLEFLFTDFKQKQTSLNKYGLERLRRRPVTVSKNEVCAYVDFPEAQLLHGFNKNTEVTMTTKGLILCSAVVAGFDNPQQDSRSTYMSHTTPTMETDATEALISALQITEHDGYQLSYIATMGPRRPEYGQYYNKLKDLVVATVLSTNVRVLTFHYSNSTDWQLQASSAGFRATPILS